MDFKTLIRDVPDFPQPGIVFRDITPLLDDHAAFRAVIHRMAEPLREEGIHHVVGIESRGFMFAGPLALELGAGFVPARKPGKLPSETISESYTLEYGEAALEIHADAFSPGARVVVVDDVLATGGTLGACVSLVRRLGATVVSSLVLIELLALEGRKALPADLPITSLIQYGAPEAE